jgi:hypothetical protein
MTEVDDAIMENGSSGELEKLLEETHESLEKKIRMSVFEEGDNFWKRRTEKRQGGGEFRVL